MALDSSEYRYAVFASYGCWEAESESCLEWITDENAGRGLMAKLCERYRESAEYQAQMVEYDDGFEWTSDQYYFVGLLRIPEGWFTDSESPKELTWMADLLEENDLTISDMILDACGGEYAEGVTHSQMKRDAAEEAIANHLALW